MITAVLPTKNNLHKIIKNCSGIKKETVSQKRDELKKNILDLKSTNVQQQIHHKRISLDKFKVESSGNRNKLQKTI